MKTILNRAFRDFIAFYGGWKRLLVVPFLFALGCGVHAYRVGVEAMWGEIGVWISYGLIANGIFVTFVWFYALVVAPYRIERDAHDETKKTLIKLGGLGLDRLATLVSMKETFTLWEAAHLLASTPLDKANRVGPAISYLQELKRGLVVGTIKGVIRTQMGGHKPAKPQNVELLVEAVGVYGAIEHVLNDSEIPKSELARLAHTYGTHIPGLIVEPLSPQSPT